MELYLYGHFPDHPHVYLQLLRKLAEQVLVGLNSSYSEPLPYTAAIAAHKRVRVTEAQRPLRNCRKCPPIYKKKILHETNKKYYFIKQPKKNKLLHETNKENYMKFMKQTNTIT